MSTNTRLRLGMTYVFVEHFQAGSIHLDSARSSLKSSATFCLELHYVTAAKAPSSAAEYFLARAEKSLHGRVSST